MTQRDVFKERLVFQISGLQAYNKGRYMYLTFRDDVGFAVHKAREEDCDEKAMHLAKTAAIDRKDMLQDSLSLTVRPSLFQCHCCPLLRWSYMGQILKNRHVVQEKDKQHLPSYSFSSTTPMFVVIRK